MIRNTRQRAVIREVLERADRPLSTTEILEDARSGVKGIGIATVYRTVKSLTEEGWLVPVELPGESPRYELAGKDHHHHFHCKNCGRVFELEGCIDNLRRLAPRGFRVTGHELVLYGNCQSCSAVRT
jgi:Fur family ferric uptake transcriptional regulator